MNKKRILTTTVDCWSNLTGANTMAELLNHFGSDSIANIYLRSEIPTSKSCDHYFQITENLVLKSILNRNLKTGKAVYRNACNANDEFKIEKSRYRFFKKYRLWIFLYIREIVWKLGRWKSKELDDFIDAFDPDILFFPIENNIFFNRINEYIIKKTNKKAICFLWDDNFTYKKDRYSIGFLIHRFFLRKSVKRIIYKCDTVFAITPKMKTEVDKEYKINSVLLTKPIDFSNIEYQEKAISMPIKMVYTGNLLIGRDKTLIKIAKALQRINEQRANLVLDVYTQTYLPPQKLAKMNIKDCCNFKNAIPQNEVDKVLNEADILLFIEGMSLRDKYLARLSFSTKLTDYFAKGKCIFAVGAEDIAPMEYLNDNQCAVVANNESEIYNRLYNITQNKEMIHQYAKKAFQVGYEYHNKNNILSILYEVFNH